MTAAPASAAQAIGEYLQSPDDLVKISAYRKKLEKEKASIDARLKSGVKEQLHATREGLRKLLSTRANVQTVKDEMVTVDRQCRDPANRVATFDQISRVCRRHPCAPCYAKHTPRCPWCIATLNRPRTWSATSSK